MKIQDLQVEIDLLENEILEKKRQLTALRKAIPEQKVENYPFVTSNGEPTSLLKLFGEKDELIVIHNMGRGCSYCTMWADEFNGVYHHIRNKAAFVLSTPDAPGVQEDLAAERGWVFPIVSTKDTTFKIDMGFEVDGNCQPGVTTFRKDLDGSIYQVAKARFGPGDDYCSVWHLLDLLPTGSENFQPAKKLNNQTPYQLTNYIAFEVDHYENAIKFYENTIGMKLEKKYENETKFSLNGTYFFIANNPDKNVYFEFAVDHFDHIIGKLIDAGCHITKVYHDKSVMISDPYGIKFHLFETKKN
ncbi:hypothetical protein CN692_10065 [Bacillus sp. AFS002410]|uniref:DUF899 family protein n=1 Tax=Bacillus sp. AFS002410 TaxID=2033481 RepID=UPI000BF1DF53|nr:DUF899 family protein [Bacillus sp. AFS002410]PEJ58604.1 hypothetical protein CN692_10065 [Bacillus sp. AFS002410]